MRWHDLHGASIVDALLCSVCITAYAHKIWDKIASRTKLPSHKFNLFQNKNESILATLVSTFVCLLKIAKCTQIHKSQHTSTSASTSISYASKTKRIYCEWKWHQTESADTQQKINSQSLWLQCLRSICEALIFSLIWWPHFVDSMKRIKSQTNLFSYIFASLSLYFIR